MYVKLNLQHRLLLAFYLEVHEERHNPETVSQSVHSSAMMSFPGTVNLFPHYFLKLHFICIFSAYLSHYIRHVLSVSLFLCLNTGLQRPKTTSYLSLDLSTDM